MVLTSCPIFALTHQNRRFAATPPLSIRGIALDVSDPWRENFCADALRICYVSFRLGNFSRNAETHASQGVAGNVAGWRQKPRQGRAKIYMTIIAKCIFHPIAMHTHLIHLTDIFEVAS
jgi:predicted secreted protein